MRPVLIRRFHRDLLGRDPLASVQASHTNFKNIFAAQLLSL